jgi:hypothetical protein
MAGSSPRDLGAAAQRTSSRLDDAGGGPSTEAMRRCVPVLVIVIAGCAAPGRALPVDHPARSDAAVGRLAGPPAILHARPADLIIDEHAGANEGKAK